MNFAPPVGIESVRRKNPARYVLFVVKISDRKSSDGHSYTKHKKALSRPSRSPFKAAISVSERDLGFLSLSAHLGSYA